MTGSGQGVARFLAVALVVLAATTLIPASRGWSSTAQTAATQAEEGAAIYQAMCARCHNDDGSERAPSVVSLRSMTARAILASIEIGTMRIQAEGLSEEGRRTVAEFTSGKELVESCMPESAYCASGPSADPTVHWSGWGGNLEATGFRSSEQAGLAATDVPNLELAWAFGFPEQVQTRVAPAVVGDQVIVGGEFGDVYSLDINSGCIQWEFAADAALRGAINVGDGPAESGTVYVVDFLTNVYALDVLTGELLWRTKVGMHPQAAMTGTAALHSGRLYVPVSSMEVVAAMRPDYACCSSSGELVAIDTSDASEIWRFRVIPDEAVEVARDEDGHRTLAPSGAPVWSSPTVDAARGVVYIGTGENLTRPASDTSDSIIAVDMDSGEMVWKFQATRDDAWNMSCGSRADANCPDPQGPDLDFGMSPMLATTAEGRDILVVGQKSGVVFAFDPEHGGELLWSERLGRGGMLGGIHWGMAVDDRRAYAPISDRFTGLTREPAHPGLYALDLLTGNVLWDAPAPSGTCLNRGGCFPAFSAAPAAIPGVVFAGGLDGYIRAHSTETGELLWEYDTVSDFDTVNGVAGRGGALDGAAPVVANGRLLVSSGYGLFNQMPGNVLLMFAPASR